MAQAVAAVMCPSPVVAEVAVLAASSAVEAAARAASQEAAPVA
jgi:hypothetical protein